MCPQIKEMIRKQDPRILNKEMFMESFGDGLERIRGCESSVVVYHLADNFTYANDLEMITRARNQIVFITGNTGTGYEVLRQAKKQNLVQFLLMEDKNHYVANEKC